ncbi:TetR/AcrR family transcriptional regulator [Roseobacter sp. YSTF-M11]|uniref:TetR/AcrR family transcriptional regulator n=1 Tax=Roseobacter insulae TaxID=2859783 RepID=A0A9X1JWN3_9RHOB|nr:TetR/AcrR family transcriptional regulator [Roseobacter insulae]MBW4706350.1 TetR/AcrR family transcriptional regulator [Roseobacter insulae]
MDQNTPKRRGRPQAFGRDEALDAAMLRFWRYGYAKTDIDDIARDLGATKPSIYRRFGNKERLFLAALDRYASTVGAEPLAAFNAEDDLTLAVRGFLETSLRNATDPDTPPGCMIAGAAAEIAGRVQDVGTFCRAGHTATESLLADRFSAAIDDGRLSDRVSGRERAAVLLAAMHSLSIRARAGETRGELSDRLVGVVDLVLG